MQNSEIVERLKRGEIGVVATDTLYGVVGLALDKSTVERVYRARRRNPDKPFIILISSPAELSKFDVSQDLRVEKYWSLGVSIIFPCENPDFGYLHRGTKTLAFRVPQKPDLLKILKATGPLVAPSANHEGKPPALTIDEARVYFTNEVDFYADEGKRESEASTIIKIDKNGVFVIREGSVKIDLIK